MILLTFLDNITKNDIRDDSVNPHRIAYRDTYYPPNLDPVLMKGVYLWPFTLSIPEGAPPSWSSPTHSFTISHHIRAVVRRRSMFARDYEETLTVRVVPQSLSYPPQPVLRMDRLLQKSCWRNGGLFAANFRMVEASLVTDEVLTVMAEVDLTYAKMDISMIQVRLFQELVLDGVQTGKWKDGAPLAVSPLTASTTNLRAGQRHSAVLVLRIPSSLYSAPSIKSKRLQCAYRVMLFVSPEAGPDFSEAFTMPLESGVEMRMPIFCMAPSSPARTPDELEALPPAYSPQASPSPVMMMQSSPSTPPAYQSFPSNNIKSN